MGILKGGSAGRKLVIGLHYYIVDAKGRELGAIGGVEGLGHHVLPSGPPLVAEILEVVYLTACFPVHVNRSESLGSEYARV
jgi:hypothetical protein